MDECKSLIMGDDSAPLFASGYPTADEITGQGLALVHFSAQPKPFWSHFSVSTCLIDWREIMNPTYPNKCAYVEPKSGRV